MAKRKLSSGRAPRGLDESTASSELWVNDDTESDELEGRSGSADVFTDESFGPAAFADDDFEDAIAQLYADDSEALTRWKDRLSQYVDGQGTLDALRLRPMSEQPWPAANNPMLGYLVERSIEIADEKGLGAAVAWIAANAWFEGAIAERSRFIRFLDSD
jgi:hypothetical protein